MNFTVAIIVTYHPTGSMVAELFAALQHQVSRIVVVDNHSSPELQDFIRKKLPVNGELICLESNWGIGAAINLGLVEAKKRGADAVILFDQDSVPMPGMVASLHVALAEKQEEGEKVAAVGSCYLDQRKQVEPAFIALQGWTLRRTPCAGAGVISVDHLISSGCLISMGALDVIGGMNAKLFIDYVDTEWCIRARRRGYMLYGVGAAKMSHNIGDETATLFGLELPVHSALRNYYLLRNGIWLVRRPWVSAAWRMVVMRRLLLSYLFFSLFVGDRFENWKMMNLGVWHGITGRMGKLDR